MVWNKIKSWFEKDSHQNQNNESSNQNAELPPITWLNAADNPWKIPILDVRPITLGMLSTSTDRQCAENAVSFSHDDGTSFIGIEPAVKRTIGCELRYHIDRMLVDGALFLPHEMEHKWAIYFHKSQIILIRSWLRQVVAVAEVETIENFAIIKTIQGTILDEQEEPEFTVRVLDFLLRSHALGIAYPAPLPAGLEIHPEEAAHWCFSRFGNLAHYATPYEIEPTIPEPPLRTHSLLHIAVARGDEAGIIEWLNYGVPPDLLANDGLTPLHWALAQENTSILELLLSRGAMIDMRSDEGATPLMNVAQNGDLEIARFLLDRGASPNAVDLRGFTAMHRAAEVGHLEIVQLLLDCGAMAHPEAHGHTPLSLAEKRQRTAIVELLKNR